MKFHFTILYSKKFILYIMFKKYNYLILFYFSKVSNNDFSSKLYFYIYSYFIHPLTFHSIFHFHFTFL
ncbi:hypothetical protein H8356DRAFT_1675677 [Neocallimastix lanati (nom. inval.)]|nr:hypothetical protein H8356DRAFT_1675677 [Neocallimastix sp. JGI-2020a]